MIHRPLHCLSLLLLLGVTAGGGCSDGQKEPVSSVNADTAGQLEAQRSSFEATSDPPVKVDTHFAAARLAESQNAWAKAIEQYQAALRLDPNHAPSMYRLGVIYTQLKAYPQAIEVWQRYRVLSKDDSAALNNLAFCYELSGKTNSAEALYAQVLAKEPDNRLARMNYGLLLARRGRYDDALSQWSAVLPRAQAHFNLGAVLEQLGKPGEARGHYQRALQLDPELTPAKERLEALRNP